MARYYGKAQRYRRRFGSSVDAVAVRKVGFANGVHVLWVEFGVGR